jgi:endo-1,3(4)-beta-glucanase
LESHVTFIWIGAVLFLLFLTLLVAPEGQLFGPAPTITANPTTQAQQAARQFRIPFREVNRIDYGDPTAKFLDVDLFAPSLVRRTATSRRGSSGAADVTPQQSNSGMSSSQDFVFPFPTGAFWTNLVMKQTDGDGFSYPVAVYPYAYKWSSTFLVVSYPALHRKQDAKSIHDYFFPDLSFGSGEGITKRYISSFEQLSVTVKFEGQKGTSWESYLVQGSPYVTIKYTNARPVIKALSIFSDVLCPQDNGKSLSFSVCSSNNNTPDQQDHQKTALRGVQFVIETQEGVQWMMFSSELALLEIDTRSKTTIAVSAENGKSFTGVLRFAILPKSSSNDDPKGTPADEIWRSTGIQRLIYHAGVYPTTGKMEWTVKSTADVETYASSAAASPPPARDEKRVATIKFKFQTGSFAGASSTPNPLLMLALPHHAQSLPLAAKLDSDNFDLVYMCIKGTMLPITGETWSYDELLPSLGFDGDAGSNNQDFFRDPAVQSALVASLTSDIELALPTKTEGVYGFGKQSARLAQLVHIADRLTSGNTTIDGLSEQALPTLLKGGVVVCARQGVHSYTASSQISSGLQILKDALSDFLRGNVSDKLVFDANLGGLVSEDGLRDPNADFGSGRYNDHHFHYGYILYACAILGRLDREFVQRFGTAVDAIMYDIAYNGNFDSSPCETAFFPGARHKSWFDGHSFASGCFPFGNGKSQESSSEAVNAYYGAYLWSLVRNGAPLHNPNLDQTTQTDFLRLLLATEIRGARTYWHTIPSSGNNSKSTLKVYDAELSENYMVRVPRKRSRSIELTKLSKDWQPRDDGRHLFDMVRNVRSLRAHDQFSPCHCHHR